jgi:hypothetical protein
MTSTTPRPRATFRLIPDEEDSGTVAHCEHMTEEEWIAAKRRRMGLSPGYDAPDFEPEED